MPTEERYIEWLERMDLDIEDSTSIEALQDVLAKEMTVTPGRLDALWSAIQTSYEELAPQGIHAVLVHYSWGDDLRFGVKGHPGLWGWSSVLRFMEEAEEG